MKESGGPMRHQQSLQSGDDSLTLYGYRYSPFRTVPIRIILALENPLQFLFYLLSALTLGIFRLILHWKQTWHLWFRAVPSAFHMADLILIM